MRRKSGMHHVYLGLGSNLGDRQGYIEKAIMLIDEKVGTVTCRSSLIETEPWGFESENQFLNCVILCETSLTPHELLDTTQSIELEMGRTKKSGRNYQDRPIDIDILLYDDIKVDEPQLKIPHPLMERRDFVMIPLREVLLKQENS